MAKLKAMAASMLVMETCIWVLRSEGSTQNTDHDMATITMSGRITFHT